MRSRRRIEALEEQAPDVLDVRERLRAAQEVGADPDPEQLYRTACVVLALFGGDAVLRGMIEAGADDVEVIEACVSLLESSGSASDPVWDRWRRRDPGAGTGAHDELAKLVSELVR